MEISRPTRSQYVFLEVKRSYAVPCVTLSGPSSVLQNIHIVPATRFAAGNCLELRFKGRTGEDNSMLYKAAFLEEVSKRGFKPLSNIADDFLVLSREVSI